MAVRSSRSLALAMGALGTLVLTQGCADDGVSLHVICPVVPTITDNTCVFDPAAGACVLEGILNVQSANVYGLPLRVESGLKARARDVPPQGEPNGLAIESATVELRLPTGQVLLFNPGSDGMPIANPASAPAAGYVPPSGSGVVQVTVVTKDQIEQLYDKGKKTPLYAQIVAAIKVKGKTAGQQVVESGEFTWPILLVSASQFTAEHQCQAIPFCANSIGTDNYAFACIDDSGS